MTPEEKIREVFRSLIKQELPVQTLPAKVIKVDADKGICDVSFLDEDLADHYSVHLNSGLNSGTGLLIIPKIDSVVYVSIVNNDPLWAYVSLYTDIDEIRLRGDQYKGLIKIDEFRAQIAKNNLLIDAIKTVLTTWTPIPSDGGAALKTAATAALQSLDTGTFEENIENEDVKHG